AGCLGMMGLPSSSRKVYTKPLRARGFSDLPEDLDAAMREGRLLPALRYRLGGLRLDLPPLRARSDIGALALRFAQSVRPGMRLEDGIVPRLCAYDWPGNVTELRAVVTQAALRSDAGTLRSEDLDGLLPDSAPEGEAHETCAQCAGVPWKEQQCHVIRRAVDRHGGNVTAAARALGMSRTTIYKHLTRA
ncbi:hypothetical protein M4578_14250, partial [Salipiger sp. P9]|uniref:helix-turn-helix domain-containing protein n=1 Tax=Salipiger pentaromativorans TaxID=2943193 RepID=UPI00237CF93E